ncbi:hypothetical protein OUZ56_027515 [Daphnia magna]|uniref:Uncharacterized protein n=1 Tax=Daphnia magna TaxID=35525 RepID=A0ABQ9ZPZ5_9CRUS|nr:hypothetical protein OUZ56_027515 [Daphnia magna]
MQDATRDAGKEINEWTAVSGHDDASHSFASLNIEMKKLQKLNLMSLERRDEPTREAADSSTVSDSPIWKVEKNKASNRQRENRENRNERTENPAEGAIERSRKGKKGGVNILEKMSSTNALM